MSSAIRGPVRIALLLQLLFMGGCANVDFNYKRFTYDLLRQDDCRRNDIDPFCARTFVFEYDEYERLRQEYILQSETGFLPDRVGIPPDKNDSVFLPARNNY